MDLDGDGLDSDTSMDLDGDDLNSDILMDRDSDGLYSDTLMDRDGDGRDSDTLIATSNIDNYCHRIVQQLIVLIVNFLWQNWPQPIPTQ